MSVWLISNYLAGDAAINLTVALNANKIVFAFGLASTFTIFLFIKTLLNLKLRTIDKVLMALNITLFIASFTPLIVQKIYPKDGIYQIQFGILSTIYFITLLLNLVAIVKNLLHARKHSTGTVKNQIYVIQVSFVTALIAILITNALIPFVFNYFGLTNIGSFFSSFIVIGIAYAILKHKLFDIRLIVARALGYILTLFVVATGYSFVVFVVFAQFLGARDLSSYQQAIYVVLAIIFGFSLPPLKKYFDKLSNKLFYRDAYDPQVLMDELNKILVGNIDLESLLRQCSTLFESTLKADFCTFIIKDTEATKRRIIGSKKVMLDEAQLVELSSQNHTIEQIIVADELEETKPQLKNVLSRSNVSILARLAPSGKNSVELGYLVMGNKLSGNPYNKQDLLMLDIIANELVIAIQNALRFEQIEAFTVTLQDKVDDATKQLRRTNDKLKALDETKDEFISMASHQLRTPLTAVKGYISMVNEGDAGKLNTQQKELLDQAFASSQRMVYLISDLLNVSRLKTGKFFIINNPTQLADVVQTELAQLKEVAAGKQQKLSFNKPEKFPELMLDENKIRQVIMNFVDNALHYTPNGGNISVNLVDTGKSVEFTVTDDGLGVPKSEQHHLFGKFFRAGNARKARPDGTGLGLFMAKKVIIAQGGAVIFSSTEGKGSTFGFTIPKK